MQMWQLQWRSSSRSPRKIRAARQRGFTLVEVLVAMSIMALMGAMAWVGVDALLRSQEVTQQQSVRNASLQVMLEQWSVDLDQAMQPLGLEPMGWDGKVFRITRRTPLAQQGVVVVAWAVRAAEEEQHLMRWQSQPLTTVAQWSAAWQQAANWARGGALTQSVALVPADSMQLYVWAGNAWVNAQSSSTRQSSSDAEESSTRGSSIFSRITRTQAQPTGVRMVLESAQGTLTKDWVTPVWSAQKS